MPWLGYSALPGKERGTALASDSRVRIVFRVLVQMKNTALSLVRTVSHAEHHVQYVGCSYTVRDSFHFNGGSSRLATRLR